MPTVVIVLNSLVSEGTPHMALDMCTTWQVRGVRTVILLVDESSDELRDEFTGLGVEIVPARLGGARWLRFPRLILATFNLVRRTRAMGVVSMLFGWHAFIAIGAKSAGAKTLAHVGNHPGGLDPRTRDKLAMLVRIGAPFTERVVCCSEYVRDAVIETFPVSRQATAVVYNGVALESFATTSRKVLTGGPLVIVMVARLEVHKDQATLIRAVALLHARATSVELQLVGDGTRRLELEALADELGVTGVVHFCGFRSDIGAVLACADVFAFSTTADEGLGIALIEAMVAEVPIVASDVGACRETLDRGACGLLVPPHDAESLAAGIQAIAVDRASADVRVAAARRRALEQFDAKSMAAAYLGFLS